MSIAAGIISCRNANVQRWPVAGRSTAGRGRRPRVFLLDRVAFSRRRSGRTTLLATSRNCVVALVMAKYSHAKPRGRKQAEQSANYAKLGARSTEGAMADQQSGPLGAFFDNAAIPIKLLASLAHLNICTKSQTPLPRRPYGKKQKNARMPPMHKRACPCMHECFEKLFVSTTCEIGTH